MHFKWPRTWKRLSPQTLARPCQANNDGAVLQLLCILKFLTSKQLIISHPKPKEQCQF